MRHIHDFEARLLVSLILGVAACNSDGAGDTDTDADSETGAGADDSPTAADTGDATTDPDPTTTGADTGEPMAPGLAAVWTVANPSALVADRLIRLTPALSGAIPRLKIGVDVVSIQSVAVNADDDAAISYDAPGGHGGVILDDDLADDPDDRALGLGDRVIVGPTTGLTAPRGLEFVAEEGLLLVADVGAAAILAFTTADDGDVAPVFTVSTSAARRRCGTCTSTATGTCCMRRAPTARSRCSRTSPPSAAPVARTARSSRASTVRRSRSTSTGSPWPATPCT